MSIHIYNTLTKTTEEFKPLKNKKVGLYTCGPTVYNYAHIGNLRTYIFEDILKRTLEYNDYKVKHVMNITDVGHLTDDADSGEDKMEREAKKQQKDAWALADFYTKAFKHDLGELNITEPTTWCKATDHIAEQIDLVKKLEKKGFAYQTSDGIYFDTSKLADYGKMANLQKQNIQAGSRVDMGEKKNSTDFALWKFSPQGSQRQMEWESPWGKGFPGWHLECSAMSVKYLGQPFDIHCGGIDHIPVHHTNEIAQSEAAYDKPLANYWMHGEFVVINNDKMAKSTGNFITLETLKEKGFSPLAYRYLLLQTHYRQQLNFSWESLKAAQQGLHHLYRAVQELNKNPFTIEKNTLKNIEEGFLNLINDDLNMPGAMAYIWTTLQRRELDIDTLLKFDEVLGLEIEKNIATSIEIPPEVQQLIDERDLARKNKNYQRSDELRIKLEELGYEVEDTKEGTELHKKIL